MSKYIYDEQGKWLVKGSCKMLIELSEEYIEQRDLEEQLRQEEEILKQLIPSDKEVLLAEVELSTINLLLEMGVI